MANNQAAKDLKRPLQRLLQVLNLERKEIGAIYFYAILAGVLQLAVPLGVQAIINFVLAGLLSTSIVVLIVLVVISVFFTGLLQVNQMMAQSLPQKFTNMLRMILVYIKWQVTLMSGYKICIVRCRSKISMI